MSQSIQEHRSESVVDAFDKYMEASAEYAEAAARCTNTSGVVVYDLVYREQSAKDKARRVLVDALIDIQRKA